MLLHQAEVKQEQESPTDIVSLSTEEAVEPRMPTLPSLNVQPEKDEMVEPPKKKARSVLADLFDGDVYIVQETPDVKSSLEQAEDEVIAYKKKQSVSFNDNSLDWWRANEIFFPLLGNLAKKYLSVPGTSVPSERVFSTAGDIVSGQRACLKAKHVDRLIFLKKNLK